MESGFDSPWGHDIQNNPHYCGFSDVMTGAGIFLFAIGKAKIPSRGREKFPSGNLFVTTRDDQASNRRCSRRGIERTITFVRSYAPKKYESCTDLVEVDSIVSKLRWGHSMIEELVATRDTARGKRIPYQFFIISSCAHVYHYSYRDIPLRTRTIRTKWPNES
jgi:hypothetical protein